MFLAILKYLSLCNRNDIDVLSHVDPHTSDLLHMDGCQNVVNPAGRHCALLQGKSKSAQDGVWHNQGGSIDDNNITNSNQISHVAKEKCTCNGHCFTVSQINPNVGKSLDIQAHNIQYTKPSSLRQSNTFKNIYNKVF